MVLSAMPGERRPAAVRHVHIGSTRFTVREDRAHLKRIMKARRETCFGEEVKIAKNFAENTGQN